MADISPYAAAQQIGGSLQFGGGGASAYSGLGGLTSGNPTQALDQLGSNYASAYTSALNANQTNYNNILSGYQQVLGNQTNAQEAISGGYNGLYNNVIAGLQGSQQSALNANQAAFTKASGNASQQEINAGLGNTTVQASTQAGLTGQLALANTATQNQYANTIAGYQANLGLAGLNYANQANEQTVGESNQQLGFQDSVNAPYPQGSQYNQLAQQAGAAQQSLANQSLLKQQLAKLSQGNRGYSTTGTLGATGGTSLFSPAYPGGGVSPGIASGGVASTAPGSLNYQSNPNNFYNYPVASAGGQSTDNYQPLATDLSNMYGPGTDDDSYA